MSIRVLAIATMTVALAVTAGANDDLQILTFPIDHRCRENRCSGLGTFRDYDYNEGRVWWKDRGEQS